MSLLVEQSPSSSHFGLHSSAPQLGPSSVTLLNCNNKQNEKGNERGETDNPKQKCEEIKGAAKEERKEKEKEKKKEERKEKKDEEKPSQQQTHNKPQQQIIHPGNQFSSCLATAPPAEFEEVLPVNKKIPSLAKAGENSRRDFPSSSEKNLQSEKKRKRKEEEQEEEDEEDNFGDDTASLPPATSSNAAFLLQLQMDRRKRRRTSTDQLQQLERLFEQETLPSQQLRSSIAQELGMSPRQVQIWFQNRRAKVKRKQQKVMREREDARLEWFLQTDLRNQRERERIASMGMGMGPGSLDRAMRMYGGEMGPYWNQMPARSYFYPFTPVPGQHMLTSSQPSSPPSIPPNMMPENQKYRHSCPSIAQLSSLKLQSRQSPPFSSSVPTSPSPSFSIPSPSPSSSYSFPVAASSSSLPFFPALPSPSLPPLPLRGSPSTSPTPTLPGIKLPPIEVSSSPKEQSTRLPTIKSLLSF